MSSEEILYKGALRSFMVIQDNRNWHQSESPYAVSY